MKVVVGIDLGSTTSKALILDEGALTLGRGITNTRSNYDVAVQVAVSEAFIDARFNLLKRALQREPALSAVTERLLASLARFFREAQYDTQLNRLAQAFAHVLTERGGRSPGLLAMVDEVVAGMRKDAAKHFRFGKPSSAFFRDLATSDYTRLAQEAARAGAASFDELLTVFDKGILEAESEPLATAFNVTIQGALDRVVELYAEELASQASRLRELVMEAAALPLDVAKSVGTGYGRARLPFPKDQIRSEILCHGLGAHRLFPNTRTVLDIGGQDTKAIQVDEAGIVTSFQMNDRCAAGCGRYLGYIATEMNLGVHELGPLADHSCAPVRITSTCTVFAGAELRDRLMLGQKREDIVAGLHRAIILRAMALLARSGGVRDEITFTGGVANNSAAVRALTSLIAENYGQRALNISPDSIYTGALGAATFAYRDQWGAEEAA